MINCKISNVVNHLMSIVCAQTSLDFHFINSSYENFIANVPLVSDMIINMKTYTSILSTPTWWDCEWSDYGI